MYTKRHGRLRLACSFFSATLLLVSSLNGCFRYSEVSGLKAQLQLAEEKLQRSDRRGYCADMVLPTYRFPKRDGPQFTNGRVFLEAGKCVEAGLAPISKSPEDNVPVAALYSKAAACGELAAVPELERLGLAVPTPIGYEAGVRLLPYDRDLNPRPYECGYERAWTVAGTIIGLPLGIVFAIPVALILIIVPSAYCIFAAPFGGCEKGVM